MGDEILCPACEGSGHQFYQEDFRPCPTCDGECGLTGVDARIAQAAVAAARAEIVGWIEAESKQAR